MAMKLSLLVIGTLATTAYADDHSKDEDQAFLDSVQRGDATALAAMIKTPFEISGVPFKTAACAKKFGGDKPRFTSDEKALVSCLAQVKLHDGPYAKRGDTVMGKRCNSDATIGGYDTKLQLDMSAGHPFKVTSLDMKKIEGELGGVASYRPLCSGKDIVQPFVIEKDPPPPPPPPPPLEENVSPTLLEKYRTAGAKEILPDDDTKTEIGRSGKAKVVGAWKLCLAESGEIARVTMLKSSGFGKYDTTIAATIRDTWKYKPYQTNRRPTAVCTVVTFIYGT
jgi:hypothetical protein